MKNKLLCKATCLIVSACMALSLAGCLKNTDDGIVNGTTKAADAHISSSTTTKTTTTTTSTTKKTKTTATKSTTTTTMETPKTQNVNGKTKLIALTFDDGPYSSVTNRILDTLEKNGAVATFFVVGDRVDTYKSSVKRAVNMGCEIGSHTYSHKNLTKLTTGEIKNEIGKSVDKIESLTGADVKIVRPPEGATNQTVRNAVNYPLIMWSVDSLDWKNRDATKDYNTVLKSVQDGSIVLMHDLYPATADAVAKLVPELMAQGYKFVTVSELMEARGVNMQNGKKYFSATPQKADAPATSSTAPVAE